MRARRFEWHSDLSAGTDSAQQIGRWLSWQLQGGHSFCLHFHARGLAPRTYCTYID